MSGLEIERRGAALRLTLNRPPVNALSRGLVEALWDAVGTVLGDPGIAVLHIRGVGRCFCAGADLDEMRIGFSGAEGAAAQIAYVRRLQELFRRIEDLDAVTVAEIGGHALGGGFELALACDLRICAREVRVGLPEVALGLVPGAGGTQRLTRLCGAGIAKRLILGAEVIDGASAAELGLVQWAVPGAELADQARTIVERISALPGAALAGAKRCIALAELPGEQGQRAELDVTRRLMDDAETRRRVDKFLMRGR